MADTPRSHPTPANGAKAAPISAERWAFLEPLIDAALDLAPEMREAYYDRAAGGDVALRAELARLVAACERDDSALDVGAVHRFAWFDESPPRRLNERFSIEREIGRGGMAVVYLAHDRKHDRSVAVKVLGPDAALAIGADRFDREIKMAARLHHPNIVPLYDSGDEHGWLYYVMPVMSGGSLRQRLVHGPLPLDIVQRVTRDIASALSYAHTQNLVHRDVKPENILFDGERAMLADFGVARPPLLTDRRSAGTPGYMSPEQAEGRGNVDERSDVYALGVVVLEMLTGSPPNVLVSAAPNSPTPAPSEALRPDLPRQAYQVLRRALAPDANDRFPTAASFADAFMAAFTAASSRRRRRRWLLSVASLAVIVTAGYTFTRARVHTPNATAFELYLRGTDQRLFRSDSGTRAAVGILTRAVAADSLFPASFAALARAYNAVCLGQKRELRVVTCDSGAAMAKHAIALDSTLSDGYVELAWANLNRLDSQDAGAAARRAATVDPNSPDAHEFLSVVALWSGRTNEALAESRRAVELSPRSVDAIADLGRVLACAGREDEALVLLQPLRSLRPKVRRVSDVVQSVYEERRMWREAMLEAGADSGRIARILAESGRTAEARAMLQGFEGRWRAGRGRAWDVAAIFVGLREYDSAYTWLDRSIDDLTLRVNLIEPNFAGVRADPRFSNLMKRMGLPTTPGAKVSR